MGPNPSVFGRICCAGNSKFDSMKIIVYNIESNNLIALHYMH